GRHRIECGRPRQSASSGLGSWNFPSCLHAFMCCYFDARVKVNNDADQGGNKLCEAENGAA
ncbi:MAG: hypothetical protein Q8R56_14695, partial [Polaromonas sp.]|nr:hypothetical protein [Polaromonas sp.]